MFLNDFDGTPIRLPLIQNQKTEYVFKLPKKYIYRIRIDPADSLTKHAKIYDISFNYKNNINKKYSIENLYQWKQINSKVLLKNEIIIINSNQDDHYIYGSDKDLLEKNNTNIRIPYIDKFEPLMWAIILIAASTLIAILISNIKIGILIIFIEIISIIISNIFLKLVNITGPESLNIGLTYGRAAFLGQSYINKSIAILIPTIMIILVGLIYTYRKYNNEE